MKGNGLRTLLLRLLVGWAIGAEAMPSGADAPPTPPPPPRDLVKAANAPLSDVFQLRIQDAYAPEFEGVSGAGNVVTIGVTMPLPKYRLLRFPQLSVLSMPAAVTTPDGETGFGDVRFLDIALLDAGRAILWGVGPVLVFPSATEDTMGQGKWQAGPAAAIAYLPKRWSLGVVAQNPISFAGDGDRADANAMILQPFATYKLGKGWFVRTQPRLIFNWESGKQLIPVDVGAGRVFEIAGQTVSLFVEPSWNLAHDGPAPKYAFTFGAAFLYPGFWGGSG